MVDNYVDDLDPCPKGDPDCETGDDGSCHDGCQSYEQRLEQAFLEDFRRGADPERVRAGLLQATTIAACERAMARFEAER